MRKSFWVPIMLHFSYFIFHLHAYISYTCNVWLWLYMGTTLSLVYHGYTSYYHYYFFTTSTFYKFNVCIWLISLKVPGYASLRRNLLHLAPRYSLHELLLLFLSILHELDFFLNSIGIQIMSCLLPLSTTHHFLFYQISKPSRRGEERVRRP